MSVTSVCPQDHAALDPAATRCPTCLAQIFHWTDGHGRPWRIEATTDELALEPESTVHSTSDATRIPRDRWRQAVTFAPSGGRVVLHFDTGSREIGFGVPEPEARRLFEAMAGRPVEIPTVQAKTELITPHPRDAAFHKRSPLWPKMKASAVVALLASSLAFLPVAGVLFALIAVVAAVFALRRAPQNAAYAHVRIMARIGIGMAVVGLAIGTFVTWSFVHSARALDLEQLLGNIADKVMGSDIEWSWGARVAAFVMILISLSIHECAHAITAWWCGDGYARSLGRVTLNPLAHIDPFGTIILPLVLTLAHAPVFGYARPVPTQLGHLPKYFRAQALVAAAGPVSNLLQAAVCLGLLLLMGTLLQFAPPGVHVTDFASVQPIVEIQGMAGGKFLAAVALLLKQGFQINVMLAFFNLVPIPPLDGSWIAEYLAPRFVGRVFRWIRPLGFLPFIILAGTRAMDYLLIPGLVVMMSGHTLLAFATGM